MSETALEIVSLIILLIDTLAIGVLICILIVRARKAQPDTAAQERMELREGQETLIKRIERLRKENSERASTVNYFLFDHSRNQILEKALAYVTPDRGYKIIGEPLQIPPEYIGEEVDVFVILKGSKDAVDSLGALQ